MNSDKMDHVALVASRTHVADRMDALECIAPDGSTWLFLSTPGPSRARERVPGHEEVGQLPPWWQVAVDEEMLRCTATTKSGTRCARRAGKNSRVCSVHARDANRYKDPGEAAD